MSHDDCCGNVVCDNHVVSGTKGEEVMHLSLKKRIILFFFTGDDADGWIFRAVFLPVDKRFNGTVREKPGSHCQ